MLERSGTEEEGLDGQPGFGHSARLGSVLCVSPFDRVDCVLDESRGEDASMGGNGYHHCD